MDQLPNSAKPFLIVLDQVLAVGRLMDRAEKLTHSPDWSTIDIQNFIQVESSRLYEVIGHVFTPAFIPALVTAFLLSAGKQSASPGTLERLEKLFPKEAEKREHILLYFGTRVLYQRLEPELDAEVHQSLVDYLQ